MIPLLFDPSLKTLFARIEKDKNFPRNSVLLSSENYKELLTRILKWLEEEKVYQVSPRSNPKTFFSLLVSSKGKNEGHSKIMVTYPNKFDSENTLIIGWGWIPEAQDRKAFIAFKEIKLKKRLIQSIIRKITAAKVNVEIDTDYNYLKTIRVYRYLRVEKVTKKNILTNIELLINMWKLVMREFTKHLGIGISFNSSELA
ncbi:DUF2299 family protein [Armatimonadetes bacterium]|nr:DUF2299 family protein [bacterium]